MESELGTVTIAVVSTLILAFGLWIVRKLTQI